MTLHDSVICSPAGKLADGAFCGHTLSGPAFDLTFEQFLAFLEASNDPKDPHGAAVCIPDKDFKQMKTDLESACRQLGGKCKFAAPKQLPSMF